MTPLESYLKEVSAREKAAAREYVLTKPFQVELNRPALELNWPEESTAFRTWIDDAAFIVSARTDIPKLSEIVEKWRLSILGARLEMASILAKPFKEIEADDFPTELNSADKKCLVMVWNYLNEALSQAEAIVNEKK